MCVTVRTSVVEGRLSVRVSCVPTPGRVPTLEGREDRPGTSICVKRDLIVWYMVVEKSISLKRILKEIIVLLQMMLLVKTEHCCHRGLVKSDSAVRGESRCSHGATDPPSTRSWTRPITTSRLCV